MTKEYSHTLDWEIISKYLSGEMTESELEVFEAEMEVNPKYAEAIKASGKDLVHADLYLAKEAFDSDDAWSNVKEKMTGEKEVKLTLSKPSPFKVFMRVAASIIILFGIGLLAQTTYTNLYPNKTFVCEVNQTNRSITLEDGSIITLNSNSKLIYPRKFNKTERRVELVGEAFFDIAKNPNKAFIIKAKDAEVKVLGTSFNINAATKNVEVLVKTGKVQFSSINKPNNKLVLIRGDFATLKKSKLEKIIPRDDNYLSWKTRQMIFRDTKLQEVAKVLNRTYQVQIHFQDAGIKNLPLTTTFDHEPLDDILNYMCSPFNLVYERKGMQVIIKKAN
ncbi:FecR domain-containing protein [Ancylomarina sp. DW003]|nr:FecR domain-containing protein [Ancylomarina sp. DW003]MDE5422188.1 FecR domain-containing protein [Ancylomarina sp. DW003]